MAFRRRSCSVSLCLRAGLPLSITAGIAASIAAFAALVCAERGRPQWRCIGLVCRFAWALCLAGILDAVIGCVQIFAPGWPDGDSLARSVIPSRAVGNLRQPNHLASLVLSALIAIVALMSRMRYAARMRSQPGDCLFGVMLSGSRTGVIGVILLAGWGLLDRRLSRPARWPLGPCRSCSRAMARNGGVGTCLFTQLRSRKPAAQRRRRISSSRFGIWSNTVAMIARQPWVGVGFGEFNVAWTLTAFADRRARSSIRLTTCPSALRRVGIPMGMGVIALCCLRCCSHGGAPGRPMVRRVLPSGRLS